MPPDTPIPPSPPSYQPAPLPPDEAERLAALERHKLLMTGKEPEFERVARLAADLFEVPIALVSLVLADQQTFMGACGIEVSGSPRSVAFCAHAILSDEVMVVPDAALDPRFAGNPLVTGQPGIRFYAGAPLRLGSHRVGTLCLIDRAPRSFGPEACRRLTALAATVVDLILLRLGSLVAQENRERAEDSARQVGEILDAMPAAVAIYDTEERLLRTNHRYRDTFHPEIPGYVQPGQTRAEVMAALARRGHRILPADEDAPPPGPAADSAVPRPSHEIQLANGRWLRRSEMHTPSGKLIAVNMDVSAIKERELALAAQTALLHATLESIEQGLAVFDAKLELLIWNERFFEMLRLPDTMRRVGTPVADIARLTAERGELGDGAVEEIVAQIVTSMRSQPSRRLEMTTRDGRTLDVWRSTMSDGRHVLTYTDITERKQVDRMKDEFLSTVSHELRTPLTSITGALGLLGAGAGGALDDKAKHLIGIAHKNAERLIRLINDLLDIGKIEAGKVEFRMQRIALSAFLRQAVEQHRPYADGFGVTMELQAGEDVAVSADPDRLLQAVGNLLSNAIKFSPRGQTVTVTLDVQRGCARITVADRGPGIPEEFRARIFQRFAQADSSSRRRHEGTGLGLSITRSIVERHGGHIGFETEVGRGSVFHIDLPLAPGSSQRANAAEGDASRILVCAADADSARRQEALLHRGGFRADTVTSAEDAVARLERGRYAAVTLDLTLMDSGAAAIVTAVRQREELRDLPILMLATITDESRRMVTGAAVSVADWITGRNELGRLIDALRRAGAGPAGRPRVLHVEDDADLRALVELALRDVAEVTPADDLASARAQLRTGGFALVVLDVMLPDGSGLDLLPLLPSQDGPPPPVVIFSAVDPDPNIAGQTSRVLAKSYTSIEQLAATVAQLIGAGPQDG